MKPTLASITKELLSSYDLRPKKSLGQHFLIDPQVVERIIKAAELTNNDFVLEIGTGLGIITKEIAERSGQVLSVDLDKDMLMISKHVLKPCQNVELKHADILKMDLSAMNNGAPYKVIGNLPYYITSPIIAKLIEARHKSEIIVLMMQKEVAQRIVAKPGSKKYGSLTVFTQFYAEATLNSLVSKSSFIPWPEVSSAIVVLKPYKTPKYDVQDKKLFFDIVHAAFQQRRKQLKNSLKDFNLENRGIDLSRRPEQLTIEEFAQIAKQLV